MQSKLFQMKVLQVLVNIISKQPSLQLQQWLSSSASSKTAQLYQGILNGQFQSDLDASLAIYGKTGEGNYRRAKFQLKENLIKMLRYMPLSKEEEQNEAVKRAHYNFLVALLSARDVDEEFIKELGGLGAN